MSTATRGQEREAFVDLLLRGCLPQPYRFGSGEVTDAHDAVSGQIDVVIEHPLFPSLPLLGTSQHRLYPIEAVAIAIEVKSSESQFSDALETMRKFRALNSDAEWPRGHAPYNRFDKLGTGTPTSFPDRIAFAIVLYRGWAQGDTLARRCETDEVDVVLQLDPPMFYSRKYRGTATAKLVEGPAALAAFLFVVTEEIRGLSHWDTDMYRRYVEQVPPPPLSGGSGAPSTGGWPNPSRQSR
jgi:hypothetical protein